LSHLSESASTAVNTNHDPPHGPSKKVQIGEKRKDAKKTITNQTEQKRKEGKRMPTSCHLKDWKMCRRKAQRTLRGLEVATRGGGNISLARDGIHTNEGGEATEAPLFSAWRSGREL